MHPSVMVLCEYGLGRKLVGKRVPRGTDALRLDPHPHCGGRPDVAFGHPLVEAGCNQHHSSHRPMI
jgi:hypothetical protein